MNDTEKCAHDLAVAYMNFVDISEYGKLHSEDSYMSFVADYESAYEYFKNHISDKP